MCENKLFFKIVTCIRILKKFHDVVSLCPAVYVCIHVLRLDLIFFFSLANFASNSASVEFQIISNMYY